MNTMQVTFDATINLGNIITIGLGLVTLAVAWTKLGGRLDMLEYRVEAIENTLKLIATAIEKFSNNERLLALIEQRLETTEQHYISLQETVDRLRRGQGWEQDRTAVDGEYPSPLRRRD